jgi:TolB-like protein
MPETVFVGIDWNADAQDVQVLRSRDLLPAPIAALSGSGRAKFFTDVIVNDIIPELNKRFRLNDQWVASGAACL